MDEAQTSELRDLLLHRLPAARAEELENQLLLDSEFGLSVESEETDLLDDFARGHLSREDAELVKTYLLATPEAERRLDFARSLSKVGTSTPLVRKGIVRRYPSFLRAPAFSIGLAASLALLSIAIVYLRRQPSHPELAPDQKQAAQTRLAPPSRATTSSPDDNAAHSFAIVLLNENRRGAQEKVYVIQHGV